MTVSFQHYLSGQELLVSEGVTQIPEQRGAILNLGGRDYTIFDTTWRFYADGTATHVRVRVAPFPDGGAQ